MTIKNNPSPFSSITWHQKEPWSCVAYSHCSTNDPHIKWIHSYCFPYNCVTKPLAILQRVIKSQRVLILPYISAKQKSVSFLSETFVVKFLDLILNFPVSRKSNYQKKKKKKKWYQISRKNDVPSLSIWENVPTLHTAHGIFLILWQMGRAAFIICLVSVLIPVIH